MLSVTNFLKFDTLHDLVILILTSSSVIDVILLRDTL